MKDFIAYIQRDSEKPELEDAFIVRHMAGNNWGGYADDNLGDTVRHFFENDSNPGPWFITGRLADEYDPILGDGDVYIHEMETLEPCPTLYKIFEIQQ